MAAGAVEFSIARLRPSGDRWHLDPAAPDRPWGATEVWLRPAAARSEDGVLVLTLDSAVTWHLQANSPYILQLRDGSGREAETALVGINLRLPSAPPRGWSQAEPPEPPPQEPPPPPPPSPPRPGPLRADPPEAATPAPGPRGGRTLALAVLLLLLLAGGAAAAWWWLGRAPEQAATAEAVPAAEPEQASPVVPAPAEPEVQPAALTLEAARAALAQQPPAAEARLLGEAHLSGGDRDGGFLLLRYAAEQGDAPAARAVAALYDPATWSAETSPLPAPNAEQAADWYRRAAEAGDAEAQYRLALLLRSGAVAEAAPEAAEAWLRRAAEQGHEGAKEALAQ